MAYHVKIVETNNELNDFLFVPQIVYLEDLAWIPPLLSEVIRTLDPLKNPYFKDVDVRKYICYKDNQPVARAISVINPRHCEKFNNKTAFFGFFESINDQEAAQNLFDTISIYCKHQGSLSLEGPYNPNHYSELGLLVKNFSEPVFFETYNPEYYPALLQGVGFIVQCSVHTRVNKDAFNYVKNVHVNSEIEFKKMGYTIRPFSLLHWERDLECIKEVQNDAFSDNWHFLPVSSAEYKFAAKSLLLISKPSLVQIVEHYGKPVGVLQCIPNVNPLLKEMKGQLTIYGLLRFLWKYHSLNEIVLFAVGIKRAYQKSFVSLMLFEALRKILKKYPVLFTTWMTNENKHAIEGSERLGLLPYKWFDIFSKSLTPIDL